MKVQDLEIYVHDKVCIYTELPPEDEYDLRFSDVFKGELRDAPLIIKQMDVRSIGAKQKGIVDIRV